MREDEAKAARIERRESVYDGWLQVLLASIRFPGGELVKREIEDHGAAVGVLPYDRERRIAYLVGQLRAPVLHETGETECLEIPAGLLDSEEPEACGRREVMEETGLKLHDMQHVVTAWTMPGISTERMHLYLAPCSAADRIGVGGGLADEHEFIEVHEVPLRALAEAVDAGRLTDMKTLVLVQTLRLREPHLFA